MWIRLPDLGTGSEVYPWDPGADDLPADEQHPSRYRDKESP